MTAQLTVSSMRAPEQLTTASSIQAPGPGTWELDVTHFARPVSPIAGQNMVRQFPAGMAEASARYGVPLERLAYAQVDGWMYDQPQPIGAPPGARTPPRLIFWLIPVRQWLTQWRLVLSSVPPSAQSLAAPDSTPAQEG